MTKTCENWAKAGKMLTGLRRDGGALERLALRLVELSEVAAALECEPADAMSRCCR